MYNKALREYPKTKFKIGDRIRISNYDWLFRKEYKPQCTREFSEIVAISSKTPPSYTIKVEQDKIIRGVVLSKKVEQSHLTMQAFSSELFSNASAQLFPDNRLSSSANILL